MKTSCTDKATNKMEFAENKNVNGIRKHTNSKVFVSDKWHNPFPGKLSNAMIYDVNNPFGPAATPAGL